MRQTENPSPEISPAPLDAGPRAPTGPTRWTPPSTPPSLVPPRRRFPALGFGRAVKNLFPGRRTSKGKDQPGDTDNTGPSLPAVKQGRSRRVKSGRFPGKPHTIGGPDPASLQRSESDSSFTEAKNLHHELRKGEHELWTDYKKFPGEPHKLGGEMSEQEVRRLGPPFGKQGAKMASQEEILPAPAPALPPALQTVRRLSQSSLGSIDNRRAYLRRPWRKKEPGANSYDRDSTTLSESAAERRMEEEKAFKKKWPGKAYTLQSPPASSSKTKGGKASEIQPPRPSSRKRKDGKGFGFGRVRNFLRKRPESRKADGESGDDKKFPGTAHRLGDST